jgi:hypothetical protein
MVFILAALPSSCRCSCNIIVRLSVGPQLRRHNTARSRSESTDGRCLVALQDKNVCETDEPNEDGAKGDADEPKKGHSGCGHIQPGIRKEGLKLFVQYKQPKDQDEVSICSALRINLC